MKITRAAVKIGDKVYEGRRHSDCIKLAVSDGAARVYQDQQGFVLDTGEFIDRKTAAAIAIENGQAIKPVGKILFSEDLW